MIEIATSSTATDVAKKQMKMLTMLFLFGIYFILINSIKLFEDIYFVLLLLTKYYFISAIQYLFNWKQEYQI